MARVLGTVEAAQGAVSVSVNLPPAWNAKTLYKAGDKVSYQGKPYQAKWWTRNQAPGDPYGPWAPIR